MKVLITAPSLDENKNVSGISTIVRQIIDHGNCDYVHFTAGRRDGDSVGAAWLLKQAALPLRFFWRVLREKPDLVHVNTALTDLSIWRDVALTTAAKLAGRRIVLSIHGGRFLMNDFDSSRIALATEKMLRRAAAVIVYSEIEKIEVVRRWPDMDIKILPNAVPFPDELHVSRANDVPLIIFFGRLHESKGLHEIIEACRILRNDGFDFQFKCYGEGPLKEFFLAGLREALGERFFYGGVIAGKEKWRKLAEADIFLLPSRYGEGLPMAMLEAMAVGCLVVASDIASVASVICDGVNGYMVEPRNTTQIIGKLKVILNGRAEWADVQENAVATVRENFAINDYIEKLEDIYMDVTC